MLSLIILSLASSHCPCLWWARLWLRVDTAAGAGCHKQHPPSQSGHLSRPRRPPALLPQLRASTQVWEGSWGGLRPAAVLTAETAPLQPLASKRTLRTPRTGGAKQKQRNWTEKHVMLGASYMLGNRGINTSYLSEENANITGRATKSTQSCCDTGGKSPRGRLEGFPAERRMISKPWFSPELRKISLMPPGSCEDEMK